MFGKNNDGPICPLLQKPCIEQKCTFYIRVMGKHPQTGAEFDEGQCAVVATPLLLIENARLQTVTAGAVESLRNETENNAHMLASAMKNAALLSVQAQALPSNRVIDVTP